jgi:hypothetical protein
MAALDGMILEHLADKLFTPERLQVILEAFVTRSAAADAHRREQLHQARRAATEAQGKITRLLKMVEEGVLEPGDLDLKERLDTAKLERKVAVERVHLLDKAGTSTAAINDETIARLASALRDALQNGDPTFRKAYLRLFVDQVIVGDAEIRLRGPTAARAKAAAAPSLPPGGDRCPVLFGTGVPCGRHSSESGRLTRTQDSH